MNENYFCRCCKTSEIQDFINLNGNYKSPCGQTNNFIQIFFECTGIDVRFDQYSRLICSQCLRILVSAYEFRKMTQATHKKLKKGLLKMVVKTEANKDLPQENSYIEINEELDEKLHAGVANFNKTDQDSMKQPTTFKARVRFKGYCCPGYQCNHVFSTSTDLRKHFDDFKGEPDHIWTCHICNNNKPYHTKLSIGSHLMQFHKEHICKDCDAVLNGRHGFYMHQKKVHNIIKSTKKTCSLCKKILANHDSYRRHMKYVHEKEQNYACHMCGRKFSVEINLTNHLRTHTDERPFQCNVANCSKSFKQKGHLLQHALTHGTEKNYACDICGIKLKSKYYIREHQKIHLNSGTFKCQLCDMKFAKASYLTVHKKKKHTIETGVCCNDCGKYFKHDKYLVNHMKHHQKTT